MKNDRCWGMKNSPLTLIAGIYIAMVNVGAFATVPVDLYYGPYPTGDNIRKELKSGLGGESLIGKFNYVVSTPGRELSLLLFYDESKLERK